MNILQNELIQLLIALPFAIAGNILIGMANGKLQHKLDYDKFMHGVRKGSYIYGGIAIWCLISILLPNIQVEFNGATYTVISASKVILYGAIVYYGNSFVRNLAKLFKSKEEGEQENEK